MLRLSIDSMKSLRALIASNYVNCQRILRYNSVDGVTQSTAGASNNGHRFYSSDDASIKIPTVSYEYVKDIPNHSAKTLVDVREPSELAESGAIPSSINIPCTF